MRYHLIQLTLALSCWPFLLTTIVFLADYMPGSAQPPAGYANPCPSIFFDTIGFLPIEPEYAGSQPHDISSDGLRVVGESAANEPDSIAPYDGYDPNYFHLAEAFGWTRPCSHTSFFIPPMQPGAGLIALGYLPYGGEPHTESYAFGISPDGKVSVGYNTYDPAYNAKAVVFSPEGIYPLKLLDVSTLAHDVSQSGGRNKAPSESGSGIKNLLHKRIVVGWTSPGREEPFLSPDAKAVYWDSPENIVLLSVPASVTIDHVSVAVISTEAVCISDDGTVIGGNLYYDVKSNGLHFNGVPIVWKRVGGPGSAYQPTILADLPGGDENAKIRHISGDGKTLVGWGHENNSDTGCGALYHYQACFWTFSTATMKWSGAKKLITLPGNIASLSNGVNYDGTIIVGSCLNIYDPSGNCDPNQLEFQNKATRWLRSPSGTKVDDIAVLLGSVLPEGWQTYWAEKVSANGRIITGYGYPCSDCYNVMGWVAGLPPEKR